MRTSLFLLAFLTLGLSTSRAFAVPEAAVTRAAAQAEPAIFTDLLEDQSYDGDDVVNLNVSDDADELDQWMQDLEGENAPTAYVDENGGEYYVPADEDVASNSGKVYLRKKRHGSGRGCVAASGTASWYGPGFNGRKTANGERFNQNALTAAHKTLKFGTIVRVTYKGRSVTVRINDAGPYAGGRVIDLSKAAAAQIGLIGPGSGHVTLQVLAC